MAIPKHPVYVKVKVVRVIAAKRGSNLDPIVQPETRVKVTFFGKVIKTNKKVGPKDDPRRKTNTRLAKMSSCLFRFSCHNLKAVSRHITSRNISATSSLFGAYDAAFKQAQADVKTLTEDPGNEVKLQMYALFKQATTGKVNTKRPGMIDFVGRAKWDAWNQLGDISQDDAQKKYIDIVADLTAAQGTAASEPEATPGAMESLKVEVKDNLTVITFNRPSKKNAFSRQMYNEIIEALDAAGKSKTAFTVVTGAGDYYSSGNDLSNFMEIDPANMQQASKEGGVLLERFVSAFIDHPKPLVALINGPAIGVAVTTLGLFDMAYASDRATFETPFMALGQSPEGCASVTFPRLMGLGKASEMMLFGKKLTAQEAKESRLITEIFPDSTFQQDAWSRLSAFSKLPKNSLKFSKQLLRGADKAALHAANQAECDLLVERWTSEECAQAVMEFFTKKAKL